MFFDGVSMHKGVVRAKQDGDLSTLVVREAKGRAQEQPALSAADCPQLGAGAEVSAIA
jgi:hypothetical protein